MLSSNPSQPLLRSCFVPIIGLILFLNWILWGREPSFMKNSEEETQLEYSMKGKAWRVYWFLLKSGEPQSVRDVQRALRFSSPSVASHHLEQLRELGLVQKQEIGGHYFLVKEVKIGVLRHYVKLGRVLFPRYFFYAAFSTTFYLAYLILFVQGLYRDSVFIILFGAFVCVILWYEAYRVWSMRPY